MYEPVLLECKIWQDYMKAIEEMDYFMDDCQCIDVDKLNRQLETIHKNLNLRCNLYLFMIYEN